MIEQTEANGQLNFRKDQDALTHLGVYNASAGPVAITEFQTGNGTGACDLGITGPGFSDGSNMAPNEGFVVAESGAAGLHLRHNGDGYVRISVGLSPQEYIRYWSNLVEAKKPLCIPNNTLLLARTSAGGTLGIIYLDMNSRTTLQLNNTRLRLSDADTVTDAQGKITGIRAVVNGVNGTIPFVQD
jgi:hypothetical protein